MRICLDVLRARRNHRVEHVEPLWLPEPLVEEPAADGPEGAGGAGRLDRPRLARPVLVNGEAGALFGTHDDRVAVIGFTIAGGRIAGLNLVADPAKLRHLTIEP